MKAWTSKGQPHEVAVVAGTRTPFAKAGTKLKDSSAVYLGVSVMRQVLANAELHPTEIDEVIFGNTGTPSNAANISRVIALRSQIPESVSCYTVHRNCASALEALAEGALKIGTGLCDTVLVGGTESMSNMPLLFNKEMTDFFQNLQKSHSPVEKLKDFSSFRPHMLTPRIAIMEGLTDPICGLNMGMTAENIARDFNISRKEQDAYALRSHQRTIEAKKKNFFHNEITPIPLECSYQEILMEDIGPREGQSLEQLAKLKPYFDKETGTITAGNACPITDGACALILMNKEKAKSEGRTILGLITGYAFFGLDPSRMGMGPVFSTSHLLNEMKIPLEKFGVVELNEAFSVQVLACQKAFSSKTYAEKYLNRKDPVGELKDEVLNINGGAVALGHPVGATGARIVLTALLEMNRRKSELGLATLCIGGGQGGSMTLKLAS